MGRRPSVIAVLLGLLPILLIAEQRGVVSFRTDQIDRAPREAAAVADVNRDGRLDIISADHWYEAPSWTRHPIRLPSPATTASIVTSELPVDVDDDGFVDLVQARRLPPYLVWLRNPGPESGAWAEHTIDQTTPIESAFLVDLDNDGRAREVLPLATAPAETDQPWYAIRNGAWVRHTVGRRGPHRGIGAGDINGDGRADLLTPGGWFEAPPVPDRRDWRFHETDWLRLDIPVGPPTAQVAPGGLAPARPAVEFGPMHVIDLNEDGRADVLTTMANTYGVLWLEQRADGLWRQHLIDNTWSRGYASLLVDVNGDGRRDLVTGTRATERATGDTEPLVLYWYEAHPGGRDRSGSATVEWTRHEIGVGTGTGRQIAAGDLGSDGALDLVVGTGAGLFVADRSVKPTATPPRPTAHVAPTVVPAAAVDAFRVAAVQPKLATGVFLVASRRLRDPNFVETVVLLFDYSTRDGAAGLVINRPGDVPLRRVAPDLPRPGRAEPMAFVGGPVETSQVRALLRSPFVELGRHRVLSDVSLLSSPEALDQAISEGATSERLQVYLGYAGWAPGQLEREIQRGDWHVMSGTSAYVFSSDPAGVWRRLIRLTDVIAL